MKIYLSSYVCVWDDAARATGMRFEHANIPRMCPFEDWALFTIEDNIPSLLSFLSKVIPACYGITWGLFSGNDSYYLAPRFDNATAENFELKLVDVHINEDGSLFLDEAQVNSNVRVPITQVNLTADGTCDTNAFLIREDYVSKTEYDALKAQQRVDMHDKIEMGGRCIELEEKVKKLELERDSAQAAYEESDEENVKLSATVEELRDHVFTLIQENSVLTDRIKELQDELTEKQEPKEDKVKYITIKGVKYRV